MNRGFITLIFSIVFLYRSFATEGMWLPLLLSQMNEAEMRSMGMKLTAEDIYSVNKGSLKDAIVSFGGFCTGEIISGEGLLLTNHHCGFSSIQSLSTLENNYLDNGFWAYDKKQEKPNPGLTATFIVRIEDVTKQALEGVTDNMTEKDRQSAVDRNFEAIKKSMKIESWQSTMIKPFFEGNQYFLFVTETYQDVRLVGAPPLSIGKFGSDTDNWVWPRHTGDFSMFRVYAGKDNHPAPYSAENVPYKPRHFLPISLDGVKEGDFTMVFGFSGKTTEYLPSYAVSQVIETLDPPRIAIRDRALKIIDTDMRSDEKIKLQYASKYATVANYWKKWIGELQGLTGTDALKEKQDYEAEFMKRVNANPQWQQNYGNLLVDFKKLYSDINEYAFVREYYREINTNIEMLSISSSLSGLVKAYENNGETGFNTKKESIMTSLDNFYKNFQPSVDRKVFAALTEMYMTAVPAQYLPAENAALLKKNKNNYERMTAGLFDKSALPDKAKLMKILAMPPKDAVAALKKDPLFVFAGALSREYDAKVAPKLNEIQPQINQLQRTYMKAQMEVFKDKKFYPDANSTLRVTYGKTAPYYPRDGVKYEIYTYLDGVMEKYVPGDYEFDVPKKLIDLYEAKDYGPYAVNGKLPVCFIGGNHTTGGNSGSPAIDANGNLIGLNFDRVWEGTMSDINYDPSICRNIMVDIRYVLFIIDKYAGAKNLIQELKLVSAQPNN